MKCRVVGTTVIHGSGDKRMEYPEGAVVDVPDEIAKRNPHLVPMGSEAKPKPES